MKKKILNYKDIKIIEGEITLLELILQTNEYKKVKSKLQKAMDFKELPINSKNAVDMFNVQTGNNFESAKAILEFVRTDKDRYLNIFNDIVSKLYIGSLEITRHSISEYFEDLPREYYWLMRLDIFLGVPITGKELVSERQNFYERYDGVFGQDYLEVRIYEDSDIKSIVAKIKEYKDNIELKKQTNVSETRKRAWYIYYLHEICNLSRTDIEDIFEKQNLKPYDYNYYSRDIQRGLLLRQKNNPMI